MPLKFLNYTLQLISWSVLCFLSLTGYSKALITDDWVLSDNICGGCYKPSVLPSKPPKTLEISADSADMSAAGASSLQGNVKAYYENSWLSAKNAKVHRADGKFTNLHLFNEVSLRQTGFRIDATHIALNLQTKHTVLENAEYRLYDKHARGNGARAELENQNLLIVEQASYTTCAPLNDSWLIKASKLVVNRDSGMAQAYDAKLYLHKIPIFYWPYVSVPVDKRRKTGFLQPALGSSSKHGKSVSIPIYFNLAPNYDWLMNARFYSKHGLKLDNNYRYINNYIKTLHVRYDVLPYDKQAKKYRSWLKIINDTKVSNNLGLYVNYANSNDKNYYADFQPEVANSLYALQQANLQYATDYYSLNSEVVQHKLFNNNSNIPSMSQYRKLPEITFNVFPILTNNFILATKLQYTNFENFPGNNLVLAKRYHAKIDLSSEIQANAVKFKPGVHLHYVAYQPKNFITNMQAKQYVTPILDLQTEMSFVSFNAQKFRTLQPKIYYLYIPKVKHNTQFIFDTRLATFNYHQMFKPSKYYGIDQIDRTHNITLALESRSLSQNMQNDMFGIGLQYDALINKFSSLAATYEYNFNAQTKILTDVVFNNLFSINLQHKLASNYVFNIGYAYDTQLPNLALHQINLSTAVPLTNTVDGLAKLEYDLKNKHIVNTAIGLEYQTCCLAFRLLAERAWQPNMPNIHIYDNQFKFQVIFKGLTGVGTADDHHVAELVPGYSYQNKW